ncbi:uncharacterized protein CBL_10266 [Carabus blaptoides fortunei]
MTDIKNREYILEAIDQLRRRKARPDIHRICNFMTRRFSVDTKDTKADLQRCVENEVVYKVEYKGNISYRNAAKKSYGHIKKEPVVSIEPVVVVKPENPKLFANIVTTAVADLILSDSDYLDFGVPAAELMKKILFKHGSKFTKKMLTDLFQREVENGGLVRMDNGNFSLGRSTQHESEKSEGDDDYLNTSEEVQGSLKVRKKPGPKPGKRKNEIEKLRSLEPSSIGIRMGGRRKRAKKVFDPSDNNLPRVNRKRGRPLGSLNKSTIEKQTAALLSARSSDQSPGSRPTSRASSTGAKEPMGGVCSVCHMQGKKGGCDKMISCRECSNKAHVSCLNTEEGILRMYPDNTWQCPHCKTCVVCYETSDSGALTVCSICADAYHSHCHEPKILEKSKGAFKWVCSNCQMEPLLTDIKPKMEIKQEDIDKAEDKPVLNLSSNPDPLFLATNDQVSPTPPNSGRSSPFLRSPPVSPTPPTLSPQTNHNGGMHSSSSTEYKFNLSDSQSLKDFDTEDSYDPSIPDASNWSYDDVYNYFVQYFPEEAIVFKEQEIDGHSLLLMKRVDVLTSLNLKLGPALKIYRHVLKLQVRRDDHKLYWL